MNFPKEKLLEVVKIVATSVVSIITVLFLSDCTSTLTVIRGSTDCESYVNQSTSNSADSTNVDLNLK